MESVSLQQTRQPEVEICSIDGLDVLPQLQEQTRIIRAARLAAEIAFNKEQEPRLLQVYNLTANVKPQRSPYFVV